MAFKLPERAKKEIRDLFSTLFWFLIIVFLLRYFIAEAYIIRGSSMVPTLYEGERLLLDKVTYHFKDIERGDIVVLKSPDDSNKRLIKRVIAIGGDEIKVQRGKVLINGKEIDEPYIPRNFRTKRSWKGIVKVPADHVFVMGDHRNNSRDSRDFGSVPKDKIIGKVLIRFWPINKMHLF